MLLGSFVVIELRSKAPLIRLGIFRLRSLTASNVAMLLVASGLFSMFYFAGIYLQEILNYGPLKAGLAFLPFTLGIVVGAVASQQLIQRIGIRAVVFIGLTLGAVGLAVLHAALDAPARTWPTSSRRSPSCRSAWA